MTRCEDIRAEFSAFIAGEPADDGWESVRGHIGGCSPCADHCAELRKVWGGLGEIKMEEVPRGALDRLHARIAAEAAVARGPAGWLVGMADAMLGLIALFMISRVIPVSTFCRLCTSVLRGTRFNDWIYAGEFTAGSVLSALSVLVALFVGRYAWNRDSSGRLAAAGFGYALLAIVAGPHNVVVGNSTAFAAWRGGVALGSLLMVGTVWLWRKTVSPQSA